MKVGGGALHSVGNENSSGVNNAMTLESIELLRRNSKAWKLLMADHAPFIVSFFYRVFLADNNREVPEEELRTRLETYILSFGLDGENARFVRSAKEYLSEWGDDEHGWLRKFYPQGKDEPHFDLTPQAQKAIEWLIDQRPQSYISFIGTESRLITVFDILRQIVEGTEEDPNLRIMNLEKQKEDIEKEIERVKNGEVSVYDETQVRERFAQAITVAREIQADFREVEENFRSLDRSLREKISVWEKGKGELLESIFEDREGIAYSEQGKSFASFWKFLMSPDLRDDFHKNLESILEMHAVKEMNLPANVRDIEYDWVDSGKHIVDTVTQLSAQLRRYVDENYIEEERRILKLMRGIERKALSVRNAPPKPWYVSIPLLSPDIRLPFDRPLWAPRWKPGVTVSDIEESTEDAPMDALFTQKYIEREKLEENIARALQARDEVALSEIVADHPIEQGLSELVAYVELSDAPGEVEVAEYVGDDADPKAVYVWANEEGRIRAARTSEIMFKRKSGKEVADE
jgi:hypothetical protein